jgi:hypothetical protein
MSEFPKCMLIVTAEIDGPEVMETPAFKAMRGWHHFAARIRATTRVIRAL